MSSTRSGQRSGSKGSGVVPLRQPPSQPLLQASGPDMGLITALALLVSTGMIMVYSAKAVEGSSLMDQGKWLLLSLPFLYLASRLPLSFWRQMTPWLVIGSIVALASLEIPGNPLAVERNGAVRWIALPGGNVIQPSEFTKLAFILFAANFIDRQARRKQQGGWGWFAAVLGVMCLLIYKEPDLGTTLVLVGTAFCLLIIAGMKWRHLISLVLVGGVLIFTVAWATHHQKERLMSWWNPWAEEYKQDQGRQVVQSWIAMSRGGWFGVGLGQSTQKIANRLPESETDFIFAIVAEELGWFRATGVLALFAFLIWRGYTIALRAPDRYAGLIAAGITSWIAVQAVLNIAVVTGTVPNTGVPLPFISQGGSSLLALMISMGILIGISRQVRPARKEKAA